MGVTAQKAEVVGEWLQVRERQTCAEQGREYGGKESDDRRRRKEMGVYKRTAGGGGVEHKREGCGGSFGTGRASVVGTGPRHTRVGSGGINWTVLASGRGPSRRETRVIDGRRRLKRRGEDRLVGLLRELCLLMPRVACTPARSDSKPLFLLLAHDTSRSSVGLCALNRHRAIPYLMGQQVDRYLQLLLYYSRQVNCNFRSPSPSMRVGHIDQTMLDYLHGFCRQSSSTMDCTRATRTKQARPQRLSMTSWEQRAPWQRVDKRGHRRRALEAYKMTPCSVEA